MNLIKAVNSATKRMGYALSWACNLPRHIKARILLVLCWGIGISIFLHLLDPPNVYPETVTVKWSSNTEEDLGGYNIYWGRASRSYDNVINVGDTTSFQINNLISGIEYFFAVTAFDRSGNESGFSQEASLITGVENPPNDPPTDSSRVYLANLRQSHPNPYVQGVLTINFILPEPELVTLKIFNIRGQLVKTIVDNVIYTQAGEYQAFWDGTNERGERAVAGIYIYQMDLLKYAVRARKFVLIR